MTFGILEPKNGQLAPGTGTADQPIVAMMLITLVTLSQQTSVEAPHDPLLFGQSHAQDRGIVLVPKPSASPNDPLNVSNPIYSLKRSLTDQP